MKKNLLSMVILALLIVNLVLTVVMMLNVTKTNAATAEIVTDIASVLKLELDNGDGAVAGSVSLADTETYSIADSMTITLKKDEGDTKDHYAIVAVTLSMDTTHEDYATYGPTIDTREALIKSEIISVISGYTLSEAQLSQEQICDEILEKIQQLFGSTFIYKVSFSEIMFG